MHAAASPDACVEVRVAASQDAYVEKHVADVLTALAWGPHALTPNRLTIIIQTTYNS